jgi:hypothetical protein
VSDYSAAESLGILPGDVIVSLDDRHTLTLPQVKIFVIFLNLLEKYIYNLCR